MGKVHGGSIVAIGLLVIIMMRGAEAAVDCITPLMKCAQFIGSTSPSADCCNALNETVNKDLACLCGLLGNQNLIKQFKGNVTQALELPKYCGITASTSLCGKEKEKTLDSVLTVAIFLLRFVWIFFYSRGQLTFFVSFG